MTHTRRMAKVTCDRTWVLHNHVVMYMMMTDEHLRQKLKQTSA